MRSSEVSEVISSFPKRQAHSLKCVRASVSQLLPGAQECIAWGMPSFRIDGDIVLSFQGFNNHNSLFPGSGAIFSGMKDGLEKYSVSKGTLQCGKEETFPKKLIKQIVDHRVEEINASYPKSNGAYKSFYSNGFLKSKGKMRNGEMQGDWEFFRRDGSLMRTGKLVAGKPVGSWTTYPREP